MRPRCAVTVSDDFLMLPSICGAEVDHELPSVAPSVLASLTYDTEAGRDFVMYLSEIDFFRGLPHSVQNDELTPDR